MWDNSYSAWLKIIGFAPDVFFRNLENLEAVAPDLMPCVGFDQKNPHHDLDVWEHTLYALEAAVERTDDPLIRTAVLFHDSGKPESYWNDGKHGSDGGGHFYKKMLKDGTFVGNDHEVVGAEIARSFMERIGAPKEDQEFVATLILHHMFSYPETQKGARKLLTSLGGDIALLEALSVVREADSLGKRSKYQSAYDMEHLSKFKKMIKAVKDEDSRLKVTDLAINGHDLVERGFEGQRIGETLRRLLVMVEASPELNSRKQLLDLIN